MGAELHLLLSRPSHLIEQSLNIAARDVNRIVVGFWHEYASAPDDMAVDPLTASAPRARSVASHRAKVGAHAGASRRRSEISRSKISARSA
jgi:hypothetical protein